ncbi:hypothetical protein BP5796_00738 [Coleophoma crateriformis]|uniref:Urease accessory protein UreD n=1 Tax=Coleophoma crateriformis TaxID=565419 RepID=A0A3D8T8W6_9HELO|nr:hypothetical protein BP5796_00738 [Coleophoma crateriformis]
MPHKHTRKSLDDKATINLPPSEIAKPLSTSKSAGTNGIFTSSLERSSGSRDAKGRRTKKRKRDDADDTPRAFARLMMFREGKKLPSGLDDGVKKVRKSKHLPDAPAPRKKNEKGTPVKAEADAPAGQEVEGAIPTIRPGEKMSEFSARVDAALPISGLITKTTKQGKDPLGLKVGRTKTEKRMHRLYAEWREEERKIQEKKEEDAEAREEEELAEDDEGRVRWKADLDGAAGPASGGKKKKGKKGKKRYLGEVDDGEDDPWAVLKQKRNEGPRRLNDVALAPPSLKKPKEKFKIKEGARVDVGDVPKASGSLRRREELGEVRRGIVEGYRAMMKGNQRVEEEE